jgi:hypothetical protein
MTSSEIELVYWHYVSLGYFQFPVVYTAFTSALQTTQIEATLHLLHLRPTLCVLPGPQKGLYVLFSCEM